MKVGVLCERSGRVRDAFIRRGHDAVSCDIEDTDVPGPHIKGDCLAQDWSWCDLLICHPVCTYLCNSGVRWLWRGRKSEGRPSPERWQGLVSGQRLFMGCWELCQKVGRGVCENPIPHKYAELPPYSQLIQPYQFGDAESKATCLWLWGLPPLMPTRVDAPLYGVTEMTDIKQSVHGCPPGPERSRIRSLTFAGIADAMAEQWGRLSPQGATR